MFKSKKNLKKVVPNESGVLDLNEYKLEKSLDKNIEIIKQIFKDDDILIQRSFENQVDSDIKCCAFYIDGMVNNIMMNENIIKPVMINKLMVKSSNTIDVIKDQVLFSNDVKKSDDLNDIVQAVIYGDTILFVEGSKSALLINSKGWQMKSISEPDSEKSLRGPHEGFTESILINTTLIRRRLKTSDLKFKFRTLGTRSNTKACICYLDSIVNKKVLKELNERLDKIDMDGVLDTNYISENIKDAKLSPFKTVGITERPDSVVGKLLEGRVALILDGSPCILTVPYLFIENFQASDDYYINFYFSSINRILRIISFFLTTSVPAIYIALTNFHRELIPTSLAISIAEASRGVPFPNLVECLVLLILFEIIREAGMRMPSNIGQALSLVGALVIGQAAVTAKIISAPMVIVVATKAITGLINTRMKGASLTISLIFLLLASFLGIYGYLFGVVWLFIHLLSLRSFGINYTSQMLSLNPQEAKDIYIRAPWRYMKTRPNFMSKNKIRSKDVGEN